MTLDDMTSSDDFHLITVGFLLAFQLLLVKRSSSQLVAVQELSGLGRHCRCCACARRTLQFTRILSHADPRLTVFCRASAMCGLRTSRMPLPTRKSARSPFLNPIPSLPFLLPLSDPTLANLVQQADSSSSTEKAETCPPESSAGASSLYPPLTIHSSKNEKASFHRAQRAVAAAKTTAMLRVFSSRNRPSSLRHSQGRCGHLFLRYQSVFCLDGLDAQSHPSISLNFQKLSRACRMFIIDLETFARATLRDAYKRES